MTNFEQFFKKVNNDIDYDPEQLRIGIETEKEHTDIPSIAEIIAKHHLAERPDYYQKLKSVESE